MPLSFIEKSFSLRRWFNVQLMVDSRPQIEKIKWLRDDYLTFLARLEALFSEMDRTYNEIAAGYGFVCKGCRDNCCLTRFYHYSVVEYLYIHEGFNMLEQGKQVASNGRAYGASPVDNSKNIFADPP